MNKTRFAVRITAYTLFVVGSTFSLSSIYFVERLKVSINLGLSSIEKTMDIPVACELLVRQIMIAFTMINYENAWVMFFIVSVILWLSSLVIQRKE